MPNLRYWITSSGYIEVILIDPDMFVSIVGPFKSKTIRTKVIRLANEILGKGDWSKADTASTDQLMVLHKLKTEFNQQVKALYD